MNNKQTNQNLTEEERDFLLNLLGNGVGNFIIGILAIVGGVFCIWEGWQLYLLAGMCFVASGLAFISGHRLLKTYKIKTQERREDGETD